MSGLTPDFGSNQPSGSATFANPTAPNYTVSTIANGVANALPQGMWQGNPIRNFLGVPAYAATGNATSPTQSVLGTQNYSPANASYSPSSSTPSGQTSGGGYTPDGSYSAGYNGPSTPAPDPYAAIKQGISSAWDNYLGSLGGIQSDLGTQQTAQNNIADTQLSAGQNAINAQKANSLKDIANTTRSAFQAGNNYLGSLGAGDSSAANQYAFAINQQAGKQTGDLNNFVNTQLNQLQAQHDQQINQIANWFSQQQQALKTQIAQGQLQKGQDLGTLSTNILNQAIAATNAIKQNTQLQYNALVQWAANNSQNVGQLQQNISKIPQAMGQLQMTGAAPTGAGYYPGGNSNLYYPGGNPSAATQQTDIFGNPIK